MNDSYIVVLLEGVKVCVVQVNKVSMIFEFYLKAYEMRYCLEMFTALSKMRTPNGQIMHFVSYYSWKHYGTVLSHDECFH